MHTLAIALSLLASSQLQFTKTGEVDLDGDGKKESISFTEKEGESYTLKVGSAAITQKNSDMLAGFAVVDFDKNDRMQELLVDAPADADDFHNYAVFRYQKGKLSLLGAFAGAIPSEPAIPGNGSVRFDLWMGFFKTTDKLELKGNALVRVEQAFMYVGVNGKPKGSPKMFRTPDKNGVVATLTAGQPIDIIGYLPSRTACKRKEDNAAFKSCDAFLVKSSSGLVGWITFEDLDEGSLPWAG